MSSKWAFTMAGCASKASNEELNKLLHLYQASESQLQCSYRGLEETGVSVRFEPNSCEWLREGSVCSHQSMHGLLSSPCLWWLVRFTQFHRFITSCWILRWVENGFVWLSFVRMCRMSSGISRFCIHGLIRFTWRNKGGTICALIEI